MDKVMETIGDLKSATEELILGVNQKINYDHLGKKSLSVLLEVVELEQRYKKSLSAGSTGSDPSKSMTSDVDAEIKKVRRKLQSWSDVSKQNQINVRVLNSYLKLISESRNPITVEDFRNAYGNDLEFAKNYPQMKGISAKNHCKVFDEVNKIVSIWEPVKGYVDKYEQIILSR